MISRKFFTIAAGALAVSAWATVSFSQEADAEADFAGEAAAGLTSEVALRPVTRASERLLDRALTKFDELPGEVQANVAALQESLAAIREKWETEYYPGVDATAEALIAAREQFRSDLAAEIEASQELRKEVVSQLRHQVRKEIDDADVSAEVQAQTEQYVELGKQLSLEWRAAKAELGADATEEEIEVAKEVFLEANAELIAERAAIAAELRLDASARASVNRPVIERGAAPEAVQLLKDEMLAARIELRGRREQAREELAILSHDEREIRRQELVAELRAENEAMKERRRELVDNLRGELGGDRRVED